jgi:phage shock protein PspC (stress-responsive transcriptional regulator)
MNMKRLYRSMEDKKIAGVCSGLGEYFDLDPVFFRLFFLVLVVFGGIGLLAYLVLCILVPVKGETAEQRSARRLSLSRTDRKLAGVCGGLGTYFEIDPVLFRVLFIVLAFVCGLGILLYAAFWLVMPQEPDQGSNENRPNAGELPSVR